MLAIVCLGQHAVLSFELYCNIILPQKSALPLPILPFRSVLTHSRHALCLEFVSPQPLSNNTYTRLPQPYLQIYRMSLSDLLCCLCCCLRPARKKKYRRRRHRRYYLATPYFPTPPPLSPPLHALPVPIQRPQRSIFEQAEEEIPHVPQQHIPRGIRDLQQPIYDYEQGLEQDPFLLQNLLGRQRPIQRDIFPVPVSTPERVVVREPYPVPVRVPDPYPVSDPQFFGVPDPYPVGVNVTDPVINNFIRPPSPTPNLNFFSQPAVPFGVPVPYPVPYPVPIGSPSPRVVVLQPFYLPPQQAAPVKLYNIGNPRFGSININTPAPQQQPPAATSPTNIHNYYIYAPIYAPQLSVKNKPINIGNSGNINQNFSPQGRSTTPPNLIIDPPSPPKPQQRLTGLAPRQITAPIIHVPAPNPTPAQTTPLSRLLTAANTKPPAPPPVEPPTPPKLPTLPATPAQKFRTAVANIPKTRTSPAKAPFIATTPAQKVVTGVAKISS